MDNNFVNGNINSNNVPNVNSNLDTNNTNFNNSTISNINNTVNNNVHPYPNQNTGYGYQTQPIQQPQMNTGYTQPVQKVKPNKNSKKILLIVLVLLFLIGVAVFFLLSGRKDNKTVDLNSIFSPDKPIIVKNNGKYGYITSKGKTMIEPLYKSATDFYGEYAIVSVNDSEADSYNETLYQIIDKKGNVKLTSEVYSRPVYYSDFDVWVVDGVLYDSKLNRVLAEGITVDYIDYDYFEYIDSIKGESGIMTYKGKKVFTVPGNAVSVHISENEYNNEDLYATVRTFGETEKELIISIKTGDILFTSPDSENYYISEEENGIFYYYDNTLEDGYKNRKYLFFIDNKLAYQTTEMISDLEVYNYQNQILELDYGYDYEQLGKEQRRYYYDAKNKKLLEERPSSSTSSSSQINLIEQTYGFKEFSSSGKYGLMSGENIIVPAEYDDFEYLDINLYNYMKSQGEELVLLKKDRRLSLYNLKNSKTITTFEPGYLYEYDNSTFIRINLYDENTYTTTAYLIYNLLSGKSMTFETINDLTIGSNYVTIKKDGKKIYYNTDFKQIYEAKE